MATPLLPPPLTELLADLESPSPSIQELRSDEFADYFKADDGVDVISGKEWRWQVRLRLFTAIGKCRSLRHIRLNEGGSAIRSVREAEARALLEGLLSNPVLEHLDVSSWDGFGTVAACVALAHILRCTRSLQTLGLTAVGMTGEGLGHIAAAVEANRSSPLRTLHLGMNEIGDATGAQHLALILATAPRLEQLFIYDIAMDVAGAEVVANAVAHNTTLQLLFIGCAQVNSTDESAPLTKLVLRGLSSDGSSAFNHSITQLYLMARKLALPAGPGLLGQAVAQMLRSNDTLTSLSVTTNFLSHGLEALSHVTQLILFESDDGVDMEMLVPIVGSSSALQVLDLSWIPDTPASFKRALFRSLEQNPSIRFLVLDGWDGLDDDMYRDLMHSLQVNTNLHHISCDNTSWKSQGKEATIHQALKRNSRRVAYLSQAQHADLEFTDPKGGRLFLCGSGFAGKTTLRKNLIRSCQHRSKSRPRRRLLQCFPWAESRRTQGIEIEVLRNDDAMHITIWDLAGQDKFRALQDHLFPTISQACVFFFVFSPYDYPTHKVKHNWEEELEKGLRYWLRFIVSNSSAQGHVLPQVYVILTHLDKMAGHTSDTMVEWALPTIHMVCEEFTEVIESPTEVFALNGKCSSTEDIVVVVDNVFQRFGELLGQKLWMVPQPCTDMGIVLAKWTTQNPTRPIMRLEEFYDHCLKEVAGLQKFTREDEKAANIMEAISSYLHDVGVIMYFKGLDFLVVNPNWVSHVFLGQLIKFGERLQSSDMIMPSCKDGFVTKAHLQGILKKFVRSNKYEGFDEDDLIHLMLKLELCYEEKVPGAVAFTRYFVPSALDDANGKALIGERPLEWPLQQAKVDSIHIGRRLQCKDQLRTFLGPGFFPRLQVRLRNRLFEKMGGQMKADQYKNERNLITFHTDGIEVLLETPGDIADYVDILVRSHKTREQTAAFMEYIVEEVQWFCASPQGSPGVTLVEGIIRPACVKLLTLCAHRQSQAVLKEELVNRLLVGTQEEATNKNCGEIAMCKSSFDYYHTWSSIPEIGLAGEFERAEDLLDAGDMLEGLSRNERLVRQQLSSVDEAARLVLGPTHDHQARPEITTTTEAQRHNKLPMLARTMSSIAGPSHRTLVSSQLLYGFDKLEGRLNRIDQKLEVISSLQKQTLQKLDDIKTLQEHTLVTVLAKMDQIINFSAELVQSEMPRRPYFTTKDVGKGHKLVAGIRIGKAVMLHFMCEGTRENLSHGVQGQVGYELIMEDAEWDRIRSVVVISVKLMVFLVKAGLHVAAGIGGAIPDYVSWGGATAVTGTVLSGESLLSNLNSQLPGTSVEQSKCMEEAWWRLKEVVKKPLLEGQMTQLFGLYRARFIGGSEPGIAWVCEECLKRGKGKRILEPL